MTLLDPTPGNLSQSVRIKHDYQLLRFQIDKNLGIIFRGENEHDPGNSFEQISLGSLP